MADFELLSTYITIKTKGLPQVLRDFDKVKKAAASISNANINLGSGLGRGAGGAGKFATFIRQVKIDMEQIYRSSGSSAQRLNQLSEISSRLTAKLNDGKRTQQQRLRIEQLLSRVRRAQLAIIREVEAEERKAAAEVKRSDNERARRFRKTLAERLAATRLVKKAEKQSAEEAERNRRIITQRLNSISLEAGFISPLTRLGGNLLRIANGFRDIARASGATALGIRLAGAAGVAFGLSLKALEIFLRTIRRLLTAIANVALKSLAIGFRTLFGPTLAFLNLIRRLAQNLPLVTAALGGLLVRSLTQAAKAFQQINAVFGLAFGADSRAQFREIVELSRKYGVNLQATARYYARISVAARQAGIDQENIRDLFEGTAAAAAALGLNTEQLNGAFLAFEQILSKGRVSAEEIRRQLADRLPGAFQTAANALGITTKRLNELLETGQLESRQLFAVLGPQLLREYGSTAESQVNRITAAQNRLRLEFDLLRFSIASRVEPALARIFNSLAGLLQRFGATQTFRKFGEFIAEQINAIERNLGPIVARIRSFINDVAPLFERLTRIIFVVNTVAIGGLIQTFQRLAPVLDTIVAKLERFISRVLGLDISSIEVSVDGIIILLKQMPLLIDIIALRIEVAVLKVREWIFSMARLGDLLKLIATGGFFNVKSLVKAFGGVNDEVDELTNKMEELDAATRRLQESMEAAFAESLARKQLQGISNLFSFLEGKYQQLIRTVRNLGTQQEQLPGLEDDTTAGRGNRRGPELINITELRGRIEQSLGERNDAQTTARASVATEQNTAMTAAGIAVLNTTMQTALPYLELIGNFRSVIEQPGAGLTR